MFVQSQVMSLELLNAMIASILTGTGPTHAKIKLAQTPFNPAWNSVPSTDFTEATFDGYTAHTVMTWAAAYPIATNTAEIADATVERWTPSGSTTPNVLGGYWIEDAAGNYLGGEVFNPTVPMNGPLTTLAFVPTFRVTQGSYGAVLVP